MGKGAATRRVVEGLALARVRRPRVAPARDRAARYDGRHKFGGTPALAHAPGGSPPPPWTLRGPQRVKKKIEKKSDLQNFWRVDMYLGVAVLRIAEAAANRGSRRDRAGSPQLSAG